MLLRMISDPKCYNPHVLKSLCHEKRHRSETAKQLRRAGYSSSAVTAKQFFRAGARYRTNIDPTSETGNNVIESSSSSTCNGSQQE